MAKKIFFWIGVFVLIAAFLYGLAKLGQRSTSPLSSSNPEISVIKDTDWIKGDRASAIVLVEYSDFQCPACRDFESEVKNALAEYGDKIVLVYRHFPIYPKHANAELAGQASEAAGMQGKFWEYHDMLFENQAAWSGLKDPAPTFLGYATTLGLDVKKFESDMRSDAAKQSVVDDYQEGTRYGVNGTPSFFLNGSKMNIQSFDDFKNLIKTAVGS